MADNLLRGVPTKSSKELVQILAEHKHVRIERIVSTGQTNPPGFWYDQDESEWVLLLKGAAKLMFEGDETPIHMSVGSYVNIPAHKRHRVEWTSLDEPTVWLAVFFQDENGIR